MNTSIFKEFKRVDIVSSEGELLACSGDIRPDSEKVILFGKNFPVIEHQAIVTAIGYTDDGLIQMGVEVTMSTNMQLNLIVVDVGQREDRRNSVKVRANLELLISETRSTGGKKRKMRCEDSIATKDISMGGVCFVSSKPYFLNQVLTVNLDPIKPGLQAQTQILRKTRVKEPGYRFRYGCKFLGLNDAEERVICEFVFRQQLLNHRKEREYALDN